MNGHALTDGRVRIQNSLNELGKANPAAIAYQDATGEILDLTKLTDMSDPKKSLNR